MACYSRCSFKEGLMDEVQRTTEQEKLVRENYAKMRTAQICVGLSLVLFLLVLLVIMFRGQVKNVISTLVGTVVHTLPQ